MIRTDAEIDVALEALIEQIPSPTLEKITPLLEDIEDALREATKGEALLRDTLKAVLTTFTSYVEES